MFNRKNKQTNLRGATVNCLLEVYVDVEDKSFRYKIELEMSENGK